MSHPAFLVGNTSKSVMLNSSRKPPRASKPLWGKVSRGESLLFDGELVVCVCLSGACGGTSAE